MRPYICKNCAYNSSENAKAMICKMCRVTEKMSTFDEEQKDVQVDISHDIKLVASVSYDRNKKAFNYDKL